MFHMTRTCSMDTSLACLLVSRRWGSERTTPGGMEPVWSDDMLSEYSGASSSSPLGVGCPSQPRPLSVTGSLLPTAEVPFGRFNDPLGTWLWAGLLSSVERNTTWEVEGVLTVLAAPLAWASDSTSMLPALLRERTSIRGWSANSRMETKCAASAPGPMATLMTSTLIRQLLLSRRCTWRQPTSAQSCMWVLKRCLSSKGMNCSNMAPVQFSAFPNARRAAKREQSPLMKRLTSKRTTASLTSLSMESRESHSTLRTFALSSSCTPVRKPSWTWWVHTTTETPITTSKTVKKGRPTTQSVVEDSTVA
mmetsp:Transcript_28924/g.65446  ORF Transcript_28924/g.65446 Transcript_28924/m.65446 type:complete len:307 (-) Transcript_28924:685-1605(-)